MLKLFGTLSVSFSDKKDSLLQCDGFDTSFNLSQYLIVSINALIARGKRPVSPIADIFVVYLLAPIMYLQNLIWTFSGIKPSYNSSNLYVESFPNIKSEMRSFKSNENIHKKEGGSYYVVSANKAS